MTGRLIVLANRVPQGAVGAGGVVSALDDLLRTRGGLWIGACETLTDTPRDALTAVPGDGAYARATFDLTPLEWDHYYLGYANSVLWPLFHRRSDLMALDRQFALAYLAVNRRVAVLIAREVGPDDMVFVQDYHFLPIAAALRALGVRCRIGLFLHIPFPTLPDLAALPEREAFHDWLSNFDLVGLQTEADVARCLEAFRAHPSGEFWRDGRIKFGPRLFDARSFPIGIDTDGLRAAALVPGGGRDSLHLAHGTRLVVGVDRLDYSKGIPNRLRAFGRWLDRRPPEAPRATLIQITPPSRASLLAYQGITSEVQALVGQVACDHSHLDGCPIRFLKRGLDRTRIAQLYRAADVGLVTPLADGMNLVAKEYVAAQDDDDPGVLILSHGAGAAEAMRDALIVNPFDIDEIADAIGTALRMGLTERRARHRALLQVVRDTDIARWGSSFLNALSQTEPQFAVHRQFA